MAYWVSFRIEDNGNYDERYWAVQVAVDTAAKSRKWEDTTSFAIFDSDMTTDEIAQLFQKVINTRRDLVVLGNFNTKVCRVIGKCNDDDIFSLVPFAK